MERDELGYYQALADEVYCGIEILLSPRWRFRASGSGVPFSTRKAFTACQPVVDPSGFPWTDDAWKAPST